MPENAPAPQASWEQLPEQSAAALRQALIRSLELENPRFDTPEALRAGVKEAIAQDKLQEVQQLLREQTSEENRSELESLQGLLKQEAVLYDFQGRMEKQMTPEEESKVMAFLKKHRLAIAVIGTGLLIGWQGAAIVALFNVPGIIKEVEGYFRSASETVQGWWNGMKEWWSGSGGEEAQVASQTEAGTLAEEIVQGEVEEYVSLSSSDGETKGTPFPGSENAGGGTL
ncbi:MAG TPA: hypothetical protein VJB10_00515 [Candidatus Peribacteraceae bacterium]|nr:hypothetical protein [Candidatus Peribacteraceae bacterium]